MRSALAKILLSLAALGAWPAAASAWEVANPGPVALSFVGNEVPDVGSMLYIRQEPFRLFLGEPAVLSGQIRASGRLYISRDRMRFPPIRYETPLGTLTLQFVPTTDGSGRIKPRTGTAYLQLAIETRLSADVLPPDCRIPAVQVTASTWDRGVPYNPANGSVTLGDTALAIPRTEGCDFYGQLIDGALGLPSPPGQNRLSLVGGTAPILLPGPGLRVRPVESAPVP